MPDQLLLYIGSSLTFIWGVAHLFPTGSVVKDFGDITRDNKNIITMEWIVEGIALIFIGFIVVDVLSFVDVVGLLIAGVWGYFGLLWILASVPSYLIASYIGKQLR